MAKDKYYVIDKFYGYENKRDVTKLTPGVLVTGSKNVVVTDDGAVEVRPGYELDGVQGAEVSGGITKSYTWTTNTNVEIPVRAGNASLQARTVNGEDVEWLTVVDGLSGNPKSIDRWFDADEQIDMLLFVNGDSNIYSWSGGIAKVDITNSTSNTLVLEDTTTTWLGKRFIQGGGTVTYDKKLTIGGIEYTYTGGEDTDTLTGVSPSPLLGGHSDGDYAIQTVTEHADVPASDSSEFSNDMIAVLYNQLFIASRINNAVYSADQTDFTNFTVPTAANRTIGDPAPPLYLDGPIRSLIAGDERLQISAAPSYWYDVFDELSADNTSAIFRVNLLKSGAQQAARSQDASFAIKNSTAFISEEPTLDLLGNIENITTQQTVPISDPIKADFDSYDFTGVNGIFWRNNLYIALPAESKMLIYNIEEGHWEAPWTMPVGSLSIIGGELYMHSNVSLTTYKLYTGQSDNGNAILATAAFSYINNGDRVNYKNFNERFTEGFITSNTTMTRTDLIDWKGVNNEVSVDISGTDSNIILSVYAANPLGSNPLGSQPLGGTVDAASVRQRFRSLDAITPQDYREVQVIFSSEEVDDYWKITAFGHNTKQSSTNNGDITR